MSQVDGATMIIRNVVKYSNGTALNPRRLEPSTTAVRTRNLALFIIRNFKRQTSMVSCLQALGSRYTAVLSSTETQI
jgi:hypothetical protein